MTQTLPALGTIAYNGFTFGGPRLRTQLEVRPRYDSAKRANVYNVYKILVTFILTSDAAGLAGGLTTADDTGTNAQNIFALLNQPGGALIFQGLGYGNITINTTISQSDVIYGPKPEVITFKSVGANLAMEVTWVCEVAIANCSTIGQKGALGSLTELVYTSDWTIDAQGLTTVVVRGHDAIALNRTVPGSKKIAYTADQNRESLSPNPPLGFRLESENWTLSEDKSREDFTFIFKEFASDNPLPDGAFDVEMHQRTRNVLQEGFAIARSTISGYVDVVKPYTPGYAWNKAYLIMQERVQSIVNAGKHVFLTDVSIDDPIYGSRRVSFSLSFYITNTSLSTFPQDSAMFKPVTITDWGTFRASMLAGAWGPRGTYGLSFDPASDVIVDHCNQSFPMSSSQDNVSPGNYDQPISLSNSSTQTDYLYWKHEIGVDAGPNSVNHYPLPTSPPAQSGGSQNAPNNYGTPQAQFTAPMDNTQPNPVMQITGQKPIKIILVGSGLRQNQPCEIPTLDNAFGTNPGYNTTESSVNHTAFKNIFGATLYAANWYLVYDVALNPAQIGQVIQGDISQLVVGTDNDPTNKT
jgi:hypothetical protein